MFRHELCVVVSVLLIAFVFSTKADSVSPTYTVASSTEPSPTTSSSSEWSTTSSPSTEPSSSEWITTDSTSTQSSSSEWSTTSSPSTEPSSSEWITTDSTFIQSSSSEWSTTHSTSTDPNSSSSPVTDDPTTSSPRPTYTPYSVAVVSRYVPNDIYIYSAVGMLQLCLEEESSFNRALINFWQMFQNTFTSESWKLATGCSQLLLPENTTYINLLEQYTQMQILIFD